MTTGARIVATARLFIEKEIGWELDHHFPPFWLMLFDVDTVTESRRLFTTASAAGEHFDEWRSLMPEGTFWRAVLDVFDSISARDFVREVGLGPDALLSVDLSELESQQAFRIEAFHRRWLDFFRAARRDDLENASWHWRKGLLNPLRFRGNVQIDAVMLAARAEEFELPRSARAEAMLALLFGFPKGRIAKALHHQWLEKARELPFNKPMSMQVKLPRLGKRPDGE